MVDAVPDVTDAVASASLGSGASESTRGGSGPSNADHAGADSLDNSETVATLSPSEEEARIKRVAAERTAALKKVAAEKRASEEAADEERRAADEERGAAEAAEAAEAEHAGEWWFVQDEEGVVHGPFSNGAMKKKYQKGVVHETTRVRFLPVEPDGHPPTAAEQKEEPFAPLQELCTNEGPPFME